MLNAQSGSFSNSLGGSSPLSFLTPASNSTNTNTNISANGDAGISNTQKNTDGNSQVSVWWVFMLAAMYFIWGYLQHKTLKEDLSPQNIGANLHNMLVITFAAAIGINILNVFFTKLAALNIPGLSAFSGRMIPMVRL